MIDDTADLAIFEQQLFGDKLLDREMLSALQSLRHRAAIELLVHLRAQRMDRRSLGRIEHTHLDQTFVRHLTHGAAERVQLAHKMRLCRPADRWIAGQERDVVEANRAEQRFMAHRRTGQCSLTASVPATDDDDIVALRIIVYSFHNKSAPIFLNRILKRSYR